MQGASPLASPGLNPGGTGAGGVSRAGGGVPSESPTCRKTDRTAILLAVPAAKERGDRGRWNYPSHATAAFEMVLSPGAGRTNAAGGLPFLPPANPAFSFLLCPLSPQSPSPAGRGRLKVYFAGGSAPGTPGVEPAVTAKPTEFLYLEQCRQPRRGGTGGDGTIRRTRRRRLRWSSPPGQVEQMPHGERSPAPPSGGTGAGGESRAGGGACPASLARRALAAPG